MRILVYPHAMEVGGSQLNAIELAAAVRDLGHQVDVISEPGPLVERVTAAGLEHLPLDPGRRRPAPATVRLLRRLIAERGYDVVHGYEWPPGVEAFYAALGRFPRPVAAVCTVMSMAVAPFLPDSLPLIVGTRELQERTQKQTGARRCHPVELIEPPVDVHDNAPDHPCAAFRAQHGLTEPALDVVVVCRLVAELKLEGLLTAVDVVGKLAREAPLRLVICGDGPAREVVAARAAQVNDDLGRRVVVLTGQLADPRPAYAAAWVTLGMGGSALRALAFGRPLIVQGEQGFFELLTPETCDLFLRQGWYGVGGPPGKTGPEQLTAILRRLIADDGLRAKLGTFGRELVVERFSLQRAATVQERIYHDAPVSGGGAPRDAVRTARRVATYKARRRYQRLRGTAAADDFNAAARK